MTPPAVLAATTAAREVCLPTLLAGLGLTPTLAQPIPAEWRHFAGLDTDHAQEER